MAASSNGHEGSRGGQPFQEALELMSQSMQRMQEVFIQQTRALEAKMEERLATMQGRLVTLEASAQRIESHQVTLEELQVKMCQLDTSVQKAMEGTIPLVDALLRRMETQMSSGSTDSSSSFTATPSYSDPPTTKVTSTASAWSPRINNPSTSASTSTSSPPSRTLSSESSATRTPTYSGQMSVCASTTISPFFTTETIQSLFSAQCENQTKLLEAVRKGSLTDVQKLLEGAQVNYRYKSGTTCLHEAAYRAHADVLLLLLKSGADVNRCNLIGTPLHLVSTSDKSGRCVQLLIEYGADVNSVSSFRKTPLHIAVKCNNVAAVRALVTAGARNEVKDNSGKTPSDYAHDVVIRNIILSSI